MAEKTYEMLWDCEYCGEKKLLGKTHRYCASCGAPQNPEKRYFPEEHEKVAVEDHQYAGADKACPHCGEAQSAAIKHCTCCGGPMDGAQAVTRQADVVVGPGGAVQPMMGQPMGMGQAPPAAPGGGGGGKIAAIVGVLVVAAIAFFVVRHFWTEAAALQVAAHSWKRTIDIERLGDVSEKGPCQSVPRDAKITRRTKGKKTCKTRKVDQGDGTFKEKKECTEAVEQCEFTVTKWAKVRAAEASGQGVESTPVWPPVRLQGAEREGKRSESYIVHFRDTKTKKELTCSYGNKTKWASFTVGGSYTGKKRVMGGDLDCDSLQRGK